ncbi:MAG: NAD(P)H-hydrate epimerase [Pseudomonadota bacterium]
MTELLTAAEMRAIEQAAMASGRVSGLTLMERAGQAIVEAIFDEWPDYRAAPQTISVLCGPGNNGGDGYVVARLLHDLGWQVAVYGMDHGDRTGADAVANRTAWETRGPVSPLTYDVFRRAPDTELYLDAIFGIGLSRPATGDLDTLMRYLGGSGGDFGYFQPRIVAVDVPSGLCADSGRVLGCPDPSPSTAPVPFAQLTVTFEAPKIGHVIADGPQVCGKLAVKSIGLGAERSQHVQKGDAPRSLRPIMTSLHPPLPDGPRESHALFRPRLLPKGQGHKYDHGHVLILTGGVGRTGAARLAARAALRVGAGAVTLASPPSALTEIAAHSTSVMCRSVRDGAALAAMLEDKRINIVCLGPGLGLHDRAADLLEATLTSAPAPGQGTYLSHGRKLVLDADALTLLATRPDPFAGLGPHVVLTPHMGEFARLFPDLAARLTGPTPPRVTSARPGEAHFADMKAYRDALSRQRGPAYSKLNAARDAAARSGAVVLLKGPDTVVAEPSGRAWVHSATGGRAVPWLATAGAGDVLAGIIAGLAARNHMPAQAAILAAALHADAARAFGPGLIAEDLPDLLPQILAAEEAKQK